MQFTYENRQFIVSERRHRIGSKSRLFLLEVLPSGRRAYVSSLYPTGTADLYRFETSGTWYTVSLATGIIQPETTVIV